MSQRTRIAIVGGGFAGVQCARTLTRYLREDEREIVLFNRENHLVFHPLLAEVVGASLNPSDVSAPLRTMLPGVRCRTEEVKDILPEESALVYEAHDGRTRRFEYDHVVLACGARVNLGMVPGMADHAFPLKTVGDAIRLRAHVIDQFEKAEVCDDAEARKFHLSFVVVGGGYSGIEVAGEIHDLAIESARYYSNVAREDIAVTVVHSRDEILPEIGKQLRAFARERMERRGIRFKLNARVALATPQGVGLADGGFVRGATVVCTIGATTAAVVERMKAPKAKGRVATEPDMRVKGFANAWAVGDCAEIANAFDGRPSPPTGQFAERQGRQCALNIVRLVSGEPTAPFRFRPLGQLCSLGGHTAVAEMFGMRLSGFVAWFVWRGVYLFKLPTFARKLKVGFDWGWQLAFPRDLSNLRADPTERVSKAFYQPGDHVFREGDPATNFYVVESGEAEVVKSREGGGEEVVAVLGPGAFFGEMALLGNQPRTAAVRARSPLELVVMGSNVFSQVSGALAPLRDLLAQAVARRSRKFWQRMPHAREVLESCSLRDFVHPSPEPHLSPETTFAEALAAFDSRDLDFCYATTGDGRLAGLLTRTDFFRAVEAGAGRDTPAKDFMTADPIALVPEDGAMVAAETMRDNGLKWLPVVDGRESRKLLGYVKAQDLIGRVLKDVRTMADKES